MRHLQLNFILPVSALIAAVLGVGCATKAAAPGVVPGTPTATIRSVGDTGFRINRTTSNMGSTAWVTSVNGVAMGSESMGYPTEVTVAAGEATLLVRCMMAVGSGKGRPIPFQKEENGIGTVTSHGIQGNRATISLRAELAAGHTYDLKCEPITDMRSRAWLDESS